MQFGQMIDRGVMGGIELNSLIIKKATALKLSYIITANNTQTQHKHNIIITNITLTNNKK